MELHQLEYVVAIAKFHSFTKAAADINTTQPLLSQQIKKLENELGVRLFERTTRNVELTSAGGAFLLHAQKVLGEVAQSRHTVRNYLDAATGSIRLGVLPVIGHYGLTSLIADFQRQFPGVRMEFVEGKCSKLLAMLSGSSISAAFLSEADAPVPVDSYTLVKNHLVLVTSILHPIAKRQSVDIASLSNEKFIIADADSGLYGGFIKACQNAGFEPDILYYCNQVETQLELVREGLAVTVLSSKAASRYNYCDLAIIGLEPEVLQKISLVTLPKACFDPAIKVFVKFALDWAESSTR